MTTDEKIEGNKLIAEFMGATYKSWKDNRSNRYRFDAPICEIYSFLARDLKYHSSWDWLISACYKWDNLFKETPLKYPKAMEYEELCDALDRLVSCYEITPAFNQLVENIKWYNANKQ